MSFKLRQTLVANHPRGKSTRRVEFDCVCSYTRCEQMSLLPWAAERVEAWLKRFMGNL